MVRDAEIRNAVENARSLLGDHGYDCRTTVEDFILWFQADTPYDQGGEFDYVIRSPLLVAHELVEIESVKAMGLNLTKDVILENVHRVDDAHLTATQTELELAASLRDTPHISERIKHISMWIEDSSVSAENKAKYLVLKGRALEILADLQQK